MQVEYRKEHYGNDNHSGLITLELITNHSGTLDKILCVIKKKRNKVLCMIHTPSLTIVQTTVPKRKKRKKKREGGLGGGRDIVTGNVHEWYTL